MPEGKSTAHLVSMTATQTATETASPRRRTPLCSTRERHKRLLEYGNTTFTYTPNGELQTKTEGNQTTTYVYDVLGNLRNVSLPGGTEIEYVIDGQGRRIGKKVNGSLVQGLLYFGLLKPTAEMDNSGNIVSYFVYGSKINVPEYMVTKKGDGTNWLTYRIITDHLGSPRLVVNSTSGTVVQRMEFDEFGQILIDTNPGLHPFGFAGGLHDQLTGLVRFGARDYIPATGRWASKDPSLFGGNDTNLYGYSINNPINYIDFNGEEPFPPSDLDWPSSPQGTQAAVDALAGIGDALLFGFGDDVRDLLGIDSVDEDSGAHTFGEILGAAMCYEIGGAAREINIGKSRIAPFGNRTGNKAGELPHYHRPGPQIPKGNNKGQVVPGQSVSRHRPWQEFKERHPLKT